MPRHNTLGNKTVSGDVSTIRIRLCEKPLPVNGVLILDTAANIADEEDVNEGRLAYATDTDALGVYDGSGWGYINLGEHTLTVPATGTATLLGTANEFTTKQTITIADAAAVPALQLEQQDTSEEFIRLIGTAVNNDITKSIVSAEDVGWAARAGWIKVYVQDDGNQIPDQAYYIPLYGLFH